ncbi:hypothetical protein CJ179_42850 [Rhodococcus sp. ACS1]|uniref:hypothetical protein n=1 Tax=Rhodococcus TaxID=1827 RepID=UPI000BB153B2|nr:MULTISPECIES: hypothetical protein [Rhodococcus]PBC36715.1 hypothetical protein CJ179_42850 [Rhodococcus sp. ACS1]QSE81263.1 hypothetical protein JWS14_20000 [Rhodococcus koreensis]
MDGRRAPDPLHLAVGAAATAGGALQRVIGFGIDTARRLPGVDPVLVTLEERGTETLRGADELADRVLHAVLRKVVQVALQEVDLTTIVRDHVDLDVVAEGIDIQRIIDRVDVDAIAARVDIPQILDRVDIDAVAARVDVDAIVDRVDVDSVIGRVDLVVLADTVIEGVDLPRIIRESTDSMSNEAVRGVRTQGMQADDAVAGFVGKLFGRGHEPDDA